MRCWVRRGNLTDAEWQRIEPLLPPPALSRDGSKRGRVQGIDGGKGVKGRKRHIVVAILGRVLNCFDSKHLSMSLL